MVRSNGSHARVLQTLVNKIAIFLKILRDSIQESRRIDDFRKQMSFRNVLLTTICYRSDVFLNQKFENSDKIRFFDDA